jgi:purine-binding chemotaxis protein CheW
MKKNAIPLTTLNERDILRFRAGVLAEKKVSGTDGSDFIKLLLFRLLTETYGIELRYIRIVYGIKELTRIPGVPDFISGIINMRGEIISIVDLKKLFELHGTESPAQRQAIILSSPEMELGIEADQVIGVKQVCEDEIQPTLPTLTGIRAQYLKGVTGDGTVILDGEKILTDKNMVIYLEDEK